MRKEAAFYLALDFARRWDMQAEYTRGYVVGFAMGSEMEQWQKEYVSNVVWARARGISA